MTIVIKMVFAIAIAVVLTSYLFKEVKEILPAKTITKIKLIAFIVGVVTGLLIFLLS